MASSKQTPPISGEAPPSPEHTPPPSSIAPPTPQHTSPTSEQISPTLEQPPPTSDTSRDVDLTYKLVLQRMDGDARPTRCSNPDDHISIRTDTTITALPPIVDTDKVVCRSYCSWAGYHGEGSVIYNRREDQLSFNMSDELIFQLGHGVYGTVVEEIIFQFTRGARHPDGRTEMEEGQYLRMYVRFAAAAGSSGRSAIVIGKRLLGNETLGSVTLSEEEILRLGKNPWTDN